MTVINGFKGIPISHTLLQSSELRNIDFMRTFIRTALKGKVPFKIKFQDLRVRIRKSKKSNGLDYGS